MAFNQGNPLRRMMMGKPGTRGGRPMGTRQGQGMNPQQVTARNPQMAPMMKSSGMRDVIGGGQKPGVPGTPGGGPIGGMIGGPGSPKPGLGGIGLPGGQGGWGQGSFGDTARAPGFSGQPMYQQIQPQLPPSMMGGGMAPQQQQQPGQPQVPEWYRNRGRFGGGGRGYGGGY